MIEDSTSPDSDMPSNQPGIPSGSAAKEIGTTSSAELVKADRLPRLLQFWAILALGGVFFATCLAMGKDTRPIALAGIESLPFLVLALLAYPAETRPGMRFVTIMYWFVLIGGLIVVSVGMTFFAVADPRLLDGSLPAAPPGMSPFAQMFPNNGLLKLVFVGAASLIAGFIGLLAFAPDSRQFASRFLPINPNSFVHGTALATVTAMTLAMIVPLLVIGEPPLLKMFANLQTADVGDGSENDQQLLASLYSLIWLIPATFLAVGFPIYRTFREASDRLGFVIPSLKQIAFGVFTAFVLVALMHFAVDPAISGLWKVMGWPETDGTAFEELMKEMISVLGAVVIGVTAGVGEELFARGVLQPRLGILPSNLLFTALHAYQYNWDGLISVFLIGMILGVIRKYTNTSTSAIVHGTYDFILVFASAMGWVSNV